MAQNLITIVSFALMLSPIISRLTQVPIEMFDYLAFETFDNFYNCLSDFIVMNMSERKTK
jgi:hypothetical protein